MGCSGTSARQVVEIWKAGVLALWTMSSSKVPSPPCFPSRDRLNVDRAQVGRGNRTQLYNSTKSKAQAATHLDLDTSNLRPLLIDFLTHLQIATPFHRLSTASRPPTNPHYVTKATWTNPPASASARSSTTTTLTAKATYRHTTEARSYM